jgi:transposase
MKLKRFNQLDEQDVVTLSDGTTRDFTDSNAYSKLVNEVIPLNDDEKIRDLSAKITADLKWEPNEVIALCYNMLVEINEDDIAIAFVDVVQKINNN